MNLPAGSTLNLTGWWNRCGASKLREEYGIEFTHWFLTGDNNIHLKKNSVKKFLVLGGEKGEFQIRNDNRQLIKGASIAI